MALKFKYDIYKEQFKKAHNAVRMLVFALAEEAEKRYGVDIIITSVYRPQDKGSVHATMPCRGVDVRVNGKWDAVKGKVVCEVGDTLNVAQAQHLVYLLNARYIYDAQRPNKKCFIYGVLDPLNKHWDHIHCQAHNNTRLVMTKAPQVGVDLERLAEDYIDNVPELKIGKFNWWDRAWLVLNGPVVQMAARRAGKVISALATAWLLKKIGAPQVITLTSYLAAEKAANAILEKRKGKPTNLDWFSLLFKLLKLIVEFLTNKYKKGGVKNAKR